MSELPAGWEYRRVDQVGDVQLGRQRSPSMMTGRYMIPYLRVANVLDGYIDYSDVLEMNFNPQEAAVFGLQAGDILLNEGQDLDLVGRCAIFDGATGICFQNTLIRFRPRSVRPRFAAAVFKHWLDHGEFRMIARQTTSIAHMGASQFCAMRFPVAPMKEQQRIVEILGTLDEKVRFLAKVAVKQQLVRQGLEYSLTRSGSWPVMTIADILVHTPGALVQTGPFGSQLHADEYVPAGVPVVMPQDILGRSISDEKIARIPHAKAIQLSRYLVRQGDVIFGRRGDLARCAVVISSQVGWICGTGCLLVRLSPRLIIPEWLALVYQDEICQRQIAALAVGSTMANLNASIISSLRIPVPPIPEQQKILSGLKAQHDVVAATMREIDDLNLIKQGLMNDLLTGRVRVTSLS
jgi:type I restriction enzyme, S subunit